MKILRLVTPALLLGAASVACSQLPRTTASFNGASVVEVPYRVNHGLVVIPVSLNGSEPLWLILDTGAPVAVIRDPAMVSKLNLRISGQARVGGAGDSQARTAPLAVGITAKVGALEIRNITAIVGSIEGAIPGVDGVIGGPFFQNAVAEFDFDARVIRFHDPATRAFTMQGDTLPLRIEPSLHSFVKGNATVNGTSMPLDLHFDTGSSRPLAIAAATMQKYRATPTAKITTIAGFGSRGAARGDIIRTSKLELGRFALSSVTTSVSTNEPGGEARLGLPVMERFHMWVDYPGKRVVLQPRANFAEPFPATTTGLVFYPARDSSARVVADVPEGTPAFEAGLQRGDTLIAVNGRPMTSIDERELRERIIAGAPDTRFTLVVRRAGASHELSLSSRTLLP